MLASVIPASITDSHRQTNHYLCNWDVLLVDSVHSDAKVLMMQVTCRRQTKACSEEVKTLRQGEVSFARRIQPISGGRKWLMRGLICKKKSFRISSFFSSQAFATQGTHVWNLNLKWCFYFNAPLNTSGGCSGCKTKKRCPHTWIQI